MDRNYEGHTEHASVCPSRSSGPPVLRSSLYLHTAGSSNPTTHTEYPRSPYCFASATRAATDAELAANLDRLADEALRGGTTALETKTGYGLTVADELRSARIARRRADSVTFLGAHLVPAGARADDYVGLVAGEMLEAVAPLVDRPDRADDDSECSRVQKRDGPEIDDQLVLAGNPHECGSQIRRRVRVELAGGADDGGAVLSFDLDPMHCRGAKHARACTRRFRCARPC